MPDSIMVQEKAPADAMRSGGEQRFAIVLTPISHPELGEIRIDESLFAVGRGEAPFVSYPPESVADLSRRHARIFSEYGAVYVADLDSKNGTTVNRASVRQKIIKLRDGDEICFGKSLSYRVQMRAAKSAPARVPKLVSMTLTPERDDLGLQPMVITRFPFLISKTEQAFAQFMDAYPHQVNYLSRRHAHIFLKGGVPYVEDLGSTNGTFVGGERLQERAAALEDGATLAFGGHHFVYRVSLQREDAAAEPSDFTATKLSAAVSKPAAPDADKTTFIAVAGSFLDIFCVDQPKLQANASEAGDALAAKPEGSGPAKKPGRRRGRSLSLASELMNSFSGGDAHGTRRAVGWGGALAVLVFAGALAAYFNGAPERELKDMISSGEYGRAAEVAGASLERDPENAELKAIGTESLLKANVPNWLAQMKARQFDRAAAILSTMKKLAAHNIDAQPLVNELEWIGNLEKFVAARGGADAPIQNPADEETIKLILRQWEDGAPMHQRTFAAISTYVPDFKDTYADALSHLRKLALVVSQAK